MSYDGNLKQGLLGGYFGYNYQISKVVIGAEAGINAGIGDGQANFEGNIDLVPILRASNTYNADIRGRFGYLVTDNVLLFATGGVAFSDYKIDQPECSNCSGWGNTIVASGNRVGYVVGGGMEYALSQNIHLKAEYLYSDFGSNSENYSEAHDSTVDTIALSTKYVTNQVRVGLSYNF